MEKPEIDFPDGPPPADLEITDVVEGEGAEATAGSTVRVHYVGVAHSSGEEFDASYNRGAPLEFRLGVGQVISGWDTGRPGDEGRRPTPGSSSLPTWPTATAARAVRSSPARR